jgi:NADPH2:quinone reductase
MMQAIECSGAGGPDVLKLGQRPLPELQPGEVLIKVAAAGVNRADMMQREGKYPPPPGASDILGLEASGEIVAVKGEVGGLKVGDQVCALLTGGGYAQYCATPASSCLPIPKNFSLIDAGSLPEAFFTVWSNVFDRLKLKVNERFLVHGGTSGIGVVAIQLAKHFGATVFATAGSDEKCQACIDLGADWAINYREQDFVAVIAAETGGKGVDVILDMVGGDYVGRNIKALAVDGRMVNIAFQQGSKIANLELWPLLLKRLTLTGSTLRARDNAFKAAIAENLREKIWPLLAAGKIKTLVHQAFPLAEAASAHRLMESSTHIGKIMLTPPA